MLQIAHTLRINKSGFHQRARALAKLSADGEEQRLQNQVPVAVALEWLKHKHRVLQRSSILLAQLKFTAR